MERKVGTCHFLFLYYLLKASSMALRKFADVIVPFVVEKGR